MKIWHFFCWMVLTIVYLKRVPSSLDHDPLIKLLKEFYLSPRLIECYFHQSLYSMDINQGHRYAIRLNDVQKQHDTVTDLKLCYLIVFQYILKLIGTEWPNAVRIFCAMLCYYLGIEFIKLYKVWIPKAEVLEKFDPFKLFSFQKQIVSYRRFWLLKIHATPLNYWNWLGLMGESSL